MAVYLDLFPLYIKLNLNQLKTTQNKKIIGLMSKLDNQDFVYAANGVNVSTFIHSRDSNESTSSDLVCHEAIPAVACSTKISFG